MKKEEKRKQPQVIHLIPCVLPSCPVRLTWLILQSQLLLGGKTSKKENYSKTEETKGFLYLHRMIIFFLVREKKQSRLLEFPLTGDLVISDDLCLPLGAWVLFLKMRQPSKNKLETSRNPPRPPRSTTMGSGKMELSRERKIWKAKVDKMSFLPSYHFCHK